ncbi:uncharacterized protein BP5553_10471 [Venustampulla echinocandica]|uniref:Uncharacterized protein n=1 Tax=Venustampulla echinocandica TaxID=2656787 RepID=A0A370T9F1_9HELO|nr:uncharacterized protein BP5553_10471 [Venustampulla echinocandica]RDL30193.1 hypothetical protein BP5553_10471 [Venustampulla echinocandica]
MQAVVVEWLRPGGDGQSVRTEYVRLKALSPDGMRFVLARCEGGLRYVAVVELVAPGLRPEEVVDVWKADSAEDVLFATFWDLDRMMLQCVRELISDPEYFTPLWNLFQGACGAWQLFGDALLADEQSGIGG